MNTIYKEVTPVSNLSIYTPQMQIKDLTSLIQKQMQYNEQNQYLESNLLRMGNNLDCQNIPVSCPEINDAWWTTNFYYDNLPFWFNGCLDVPYNYASMVTKISIEQRSVCSNKTDWILPSIQQVFSNVCINSENNNQSYKSQRDAFWNSQLDLDMYSPATDPIFEYRLCQLLNSIESIDSYNWRENLQYVNNLKNYEQPQYYNMEYGWSNEQVTTPKTQVSEQEKFNASGSPFKVTSCIGVPFEVSFKVTNLRFWSIPIETQYAKSSQTLSGKIATSVN